ncbi:hypothetical protein SDC9_171616 [bioreactor metagenome]|uniref:Uncharacterized protein n=1 Tax=bioreactor metagenome TaxID=1076179 RepID=A0A645GDY5_9ZZZZ
MGLIHLIKPVKQMRQIFLVDLPWVGYADLQLFAFIFRLKRNGAGSYSMLNGVVQNGDEHLFGSIRVGIGPRAGIWQEGFYGKAFFFRRGAIAVRYIINQFI